MFCGEPVLRGVTFLRNSFICEWQRRRAALPVPGAGLPAVSGGPGRMHPQPDDDRPLAALWSSPCGLLSINRERLLTNAMNTALATRSLLGSYMRECAPLRS